MLLNHQHTRTFEEIFPYFAYENDILVMADGRVGMGFQLNALEMERLSSGEYDKIGENIAQALKSLEVGACVQLVGFYYYDKPQFSIKEKNPYQEKFINFFGERPIQQHIAYLFISFGESKNYSLSNNFFARGGRIRQNLMVNTSFYKKRLELIANNFISMASIGGLSFKRLSEADLMQVLLQYFNLDFGNKHHNVYKTFTPAKDRLILGTDTLNIISLSGQSPHVYNDRANLYGVSAPNLYPLTNYLEIPHILSISFKPLDTQSAVNDLEFEGKTITRLDFMMREEHRAKGRDIFDFLNEVSSAGNSLLDVSVQCSVWNQFNDTQALIQEVMKAYRAMGAECYVESLDTMNLFVSNAPANSYQNFRWLRMTNEVAACYFNGISLVKSDSKGDLLLDSLGNPILKDFYNTLLNNNNFLVIGPTGSGKSFTIGNFIVQRFYRKERQIIIDVGGTYLSIFYGLPPEDCRYYEYDPEKPLKYNPFLIKREALTGKFLLTADKANFLNTLIATIWRGNQPLSNVEKSILDKRLSQYYQAYNETLNGLPSIAGFYDFLQKYHAENQGTISYLQEERNFDLHGLLSTLEQFAVGIYKDILNSDKYENLADYRLICFDLAKVKDNITLYPIVGMLITELAADSISNYPTDIKRLYFDEAWSMLNGCLGDFIEYMYRTIRKAEGTIGIITQGITELENSGIGKILKNNSSTFIILRHTDSSVLENVNKYLGLKVHEGELLNSLRKAADDKWREIFVKQSEWANVYRVEVPPAITAILTSKAEDRNFIRNLSENGKYFDFAINRFVEKVSHV